MDLSAVVAHNLKRVCVEHDISTRDLAQRMGEKSQKSVWNLLNNEHSPRLSTLEPLCRVLMVSHQAVVTPNVDTSLLVSRRLPGANKGLQPHDTDPEGQSGGHYPAYAVRMRGGKFGEISITCEKSEYRV